MAIDGLVILDGAGRPIIQSGFRSVPSGYPVLHIDTFNNALANLDRVDLVDPVLYLQQPGIGVPSACCHIKRGDLRFLCLISGETDPLYVLSFLEMFVDILIDYFGHLSAETLKDGFDIVYQAWSMSIFLLEETLDAGGHPSTTSKNALKDIILPPSLLSKVLSVAGVSGLASPGASAHPFASPIPWRKAGVRYNNNEIFFDIAEELKAVVNRNGTYVSSTIWGSITANSKLSGVPDLLLSFSNPQSLADCSFHPCVRLQKWSRDKQLSFVPPDGRFVLMEYRYAKEMTHPSPLPCILKSSVTSDEKGSSLDITISSRLTTKLLENVTVTLFLGECVTSANFAVSNNASWAFEPKTRILRWEMKAIAPSSSYNLRGTFSSGSDLPRPSRAFRVTFEVANHTFSSLKVNQLKLSGEAYKPYKGVRGYSKGDVEWRW
ncbi:clathrin adaptor mu subunit [Panus rudis PR-1116 ss-1]|nr:clathrin adaptor mu subunit [Panus rudis PR-1116 ss-1]